MKKYLQRLVNIGGAPLGTPPALPVPTESSNKLTRELSELLHRRNGFHAFESALHVFPSSAASSGPSLSEWNSHELWRHEYGDLARDKLFFAEDAFGNQFCIEGDHIYTFDAETGTCERLCGSLEEWAETILGDYNVLTGYPLLHAWQSAHGGLPSNERCGPPLSSWRLRQARPDQVRYQRTP
jgi:hypothetical protein